MARNSAQRSHPHTAMRGTPIRIGIIGCGYVTDTRHLPALSQVPGASVVAAADIEESRRNTVATKYRIPHRFADVDELLESIDVDVIAICVPAFFHVEIARKVLAAGKHLFVEKPLALTTVECESLLRTAQGSGRKAMVGFNLRWHPLIRQTRRILQEGRLSQVHCLSSIFASGSRFNPQVPPWRHSRESGGGVINEQAVHHFDLWRFLLQSEVEEVCGFSDNEDETATVIARMTNGTLLSALFCEASADNLQFDVYGQSGRLHVSCYQFDGLELSSRSVHPGDLRVRLKKFLGFLKGLPRAGYQLRSGGEYISSYRHQWVHFTEAIRHALPVECTLEDGLRATQILEAVRESTVRRAAVRLTAFENV